MLIVGDQSPLKIIRLKKIEKSQEIIVIRTYIVKYLKIILLKHEI